MGQKYATLSLGTRQDAKTWDQGCQRLGMTETVSVRKPKPTDDELDSVFDSGANWLYLAGHFGVDTLYNEDGTLELTFEKNRIRVNRDGKWKRDIMKGGGFTLHESCWVVVWGGCSVCSNGENIRTMFSLFDQHLLLGFRGLTGWQVLDAMLGGGFIKDKHFFSNVRSDPSDPTVVRDAWLEAALKGYGNTTYEGKFRAVDPDKQEWKIEKNKIVQGRQL
jgi:hypothetical protein